MTTPSEPTRTHSSDPVVRFFGAEIAHGGPFALLNVHPDVCSTDTVQSALRTRLMQVADHPHRDTPAAGEAVLALHAAAAQLLDPATLDALRAQWRTTVGNDHPTDHLAEAPSNEPAPTHAPIPVPNQPASPPPIVVPHQPNQSAPLREDYPSSVLHSDIPRVLALHGGWGREAMAHLLAIAHSRGLNADDLALALSSYASPAGHGTSTPAVVGSQSILHTANTATAQFDIGIDEHESATDELVVRWAVAAGALIVSVFVLVGALIAAASFGWFSGPTSDEQQTRIEDTPPIADANTPADTPTTNTPSQTSATPATDTDLPATSTVTLTTENVLRAVRKLGSAPSSSDTIADALAQFDRANDVVAHGWTLVGNDVRIAAQHEIIEMFFRLQAGSDERQAFVRSLTEPLNTITHARISPSDIAPALWSGGILARLSREPALTPLERSRIDTAARPAGIMDPPRERRSFQSGMSAVLDWLPRACVAPASQPHSDAFVACFDEIADLAHIIAPATDDTNTIRNTLAADKAVLHALEVLLVSGPDPATDAQALKAIDHLIARVGWRETDPARARLLSWFSRDDISHSDIRAVTSSLARTSAAEGVDLTMVLASDASHTDRIALRDTYASSWLLEPENVSPALARWQLARTTANTKATHDASAAQILSAAVGFARLNAAAHWLWLGDEEAAMIEMDLFDAMPAVQTVSNASNRSLRRTNDSAWMRRYMGLGRNIPARIVMLEEKRGGTIGWIDGEVIATEALRSPTGEVRKTARAVLLTTNNKSAALNGVLNELPSIRTPTSEVSEFIETLSLTSLPNIDSPHWHIAARRAVIDRLLHLLANELSEHKVDELATLLAIVYEHRTLENAQDASEVASMNPESASAVLFQRWLDTTVSARTAPGFSLSPNGIEQQRIARYRLAQGIVQRFAANQISTLELMGVVVAGERSDAVSRIERTIATTEGERRAAQHVFEQILVVESAMTDLWMFRLKLDNAVTATHIDTAPADTDADPIKPEETAAPDTTSSHEE